MRWVLLMLCLSSSLACERKAPGPKECQEFALRAVGVTDPELLQVPRVQIRVDEMTRKCLTTPYDREYVRCLEVSGRLRTCSLEFQLRSANQVD